MVRQRTLLGGQLILNVLIFLIMGIGILATAEQYSEYREYAFYNNARMLVADQLHELEGLFGEDGFHDEQIDHEKDTVKLVVADLNGVVLYSEREEYKKGDIVELNEFVQVDQSLFVSSSEMVKMAFVIRSQGKSYGFAAFFMPKEEALGVSSREIAVKIFAPVILAFLLVMVILAWNRHNLRMYVVDPVGEMIVSSRAIIDGNYGIPVVKTKSSKIMNNDIDKLAYQFELMRDELQEKRICEERMRKSQKELISCISHDLKTPITTIRAYGEGIRDGLAREPEKVKSYGETIVNKTEVLTKMITDLIEHSNAELNQLSIVRKEQYIKGFMNQLADELKEVVQHYGMNFYYENHAPDMLLAYDEHRITQVILNLVDNAIKYGKEGGEIKVLAECDDVNKKYRITVSDNGNGIAAADIPYVFNKFYRGEKSRSSSVPGSGLGLAICKYIVESHEGDLICESRAGKGTSFIIILNTN